MPLLRTTIESGLTTDRIAGKTIVYRQASRAIVRRDDLILLLYTQRYRDYSLPGGGLEEDEDPVEGLIRELEEETGARNIRNIQPFGSYEEYRSWYKPADSVLHMISYCYTAEVDPHLGNTSMEGYELRNGMQPVWITLDEAIRYNQATMAGGPNQGQSIERETYILSLLRDSPST